MRRIVANRVLAAARCAPAVVVGVAGMHLAAGRAQAQLFEPPIPYETGGSTFDVEIADVNGDAQPDVLSLGYRYVDGYLRFDVLNVFLNSGQGALLPGIGVALPHDAHDVSAGDLDGDGDADLVVSGFAHATILWSDGLGGFPAESSLSFGARYAHHSAIGDLTGDGEADIVVADRDRGEVVVFVGLGGGSFAQPRHLPTGDDPYGLTIADMNGDGHADVVVPIVSSSFAVGILSGNGTGALTSLDTVLLPASAVASAVAAGDLTGDGLPEIVTPNGPLDSVSVFRNDAGRLSLTFTSAFVARASSVGIADINGDGRMDVVAGAYDAGTVSALLGNGDGSLGAPQTYPAAVQRNQAVAVADLSGDGLPDVVSAGPNATAIAVLIHAAPLEVDAGPDVFTTAIGGAPVTLSATVLSQHTGVSFRWWGAGGELGTSAILSASFPIGTHQLLLEAVAPDGAFATDTVTVTVEASFATQSSLDVLHARVEELGRPAQQAGVDELIQQVRSLDADLKTQRLVIDTLVRFVQGKVDATVGSRASSQELAAAVTELKASGLSQESLDALGASVREVVASVRQELLRASIETALARRDGVAFFMLPASAGGLLEVVRGIVADTVAFYPASASDSRRAQEQLASGDAALSAGEHAAAYRDFADAYRTSTGSGRR